MSQPLQADVIAAIDSRVAEIRTDYEKRLEKDRALTGTVVKWISSSVAIAFSVLAYFGIKGFDDLVDRAIQRNYPREKWETIMENVRDHALVYALAQEQRGPGAYGDREIDAFHRLLQTRETRIHTFQEVMALLRDRRRLPDTEPTLQVMTEILRGRGKYEWIDLYAPKQEALVAFLADYKYQPASEAVLRHLGSRKKELQLAAIRYVRECRVQEAGKSLAHLVKTDNDLEVRDAAATALLTMGGATAEAEQWLSDLTSHPLGSVEEAASALTRLTAAAQVTVTELRGARNASLASAPASGYLRASLVRQSRDMPGNPAVKTTLDLLRAVLMKNYILSMAEDEGRRLVYVTSNAKTYSEKNLSPVLVSSPLVDALLRREVQAGANLDTLRRLVRGLSGIVTEREVLDIRQEVILVLGAGEIELADGQKYSQALAEQLAGKLSRDQLIALKWNIRTWRLRVSEAGDLMAESTSASAPQPSGKLKSIKLGEASAFRIIDVFGDLPPEQQARLRSARLP